MLSVVERPASMFWPTVRDWLLEARPAFPERDPIPREDSTALDSLGPAVIASSRLELPEPERISSAQPVTWSLSRLIWSPIWFRFDHRNTPAPTAAAAAAAVAIGRSRTLSIQSLLYWLRPAGLLFLLPR
jgi:hypothetical protein